MTAILRSLNILNRSPQKRSSKKSVKNNIQALNEDWWNSLGHVISNNSHSSLEQEIDNFINEKI